MPLKDWKPKYIKSLFPPKPLPCTHEALPHTQLHTIMLDYGCLGMTCFVSLWLGSPELLSPYQIALGRFCVINRICHSCIEPIVQG